MENIIKYIKINRRIQVLNDNHLLMITKDGQEFSGQSASLFSSLFQSDSILKAHFEAYHFN